MGDDGQFLASITRVGSKLSSLRRGKQAGKIFFACDDLLHKSDPYSAVKLQRNNGSGADCNGMETLLVISQFL